MLPKTCSTPASFPTRTKELCSAFSKLSLHQCHKPAGGLVVEERGAMGLGGVGGPSWPTVLCGVAARSRWSRK